MVRPLLMRLRQLLIFIFGLATTLPVPAQQPVPPTPPPAAPLSEQAQRILLLRNKLTSRQDAEKALKDTRAELKAAAADPEKKSRLEEQEKKQSEALTAMTAELHRELSGVSDPGLAAEKGDNGLEAQFREVVKPALEMMNDLMKQPREISDLRRAIEALKKEIPGLEKAIAGLTKTTADVEADKDKKTNAPLLAELKRQLDDHRQSLTVKKSQLTVFERRLEELMAERQGFGHYAAQLWSGFVLKRLLNILLAVAAFTGVLFLLRWVRRWITRRGLRKRLRASPFVARATEVLFHVLSVVAAIFTAFIVLWISGDWLLLTLAMLVVAGLILVSRHTVPRMYEQARILLNLGGVREGERVIWHGLPWLVKRLHFSSTLQNPALTGGSLRLPLREMGQLLSRPSGQKERWFPTDEGDWVELSDGTIGKVVLQTPESVQLVPVGGSFKTYTTTDFLSRTPRNLSHNFRVQSRFGLDYRHTADVLGTAPEILAAALRQGYRRLVEEDGIIRVNVELVEAASSSLDLLVLADFTGKAAPHYAALHRLTQRLCLETTAANKWTVAFPQMVVHRAEEAGE